MSNNKSCEICVNFEVEVNEETHQATEFNCKANVKEFLKQLISGSTILCKEWADE